MVYHISHYQLNSFFIFVVFVTSASTYAFISQIIVYDTTAPLMVAFMDRVRVRSAYAPWYFNFTAQVCFTTWSDNSLIRDLESWLTILWDISHNI